LRVRYAYIDWLSCSATSGAPLDAIAHMTRGRAAVSTCSSPGIGGTRRCRTQSPPTLVTKWLMESVLSMFAPCRIGLICSRCLRRVISPRAPTESCSVHDAALNAATAALPALALAHRSLGVSIVAGCASLRVPVQRDRRASAIVAGGRGDDPRTEPSQYFRYLSGGPARKMANLYSYPVTGPARRPCTL
jgi:hypothetical protein